MLFFPSLLLLLSSMSSLPTGFVYLRDVIPDIQISLRYATTENFVGSRVDGYLSNVSIISEAAALALKQVQTAAKARGYELVIYDGYRPQKSVDHFVRWSADCRDPQRSKEHYYPRTDKAKAFELGYIAKRSGHTRGSTVDLTLIPLGQRLVDPLIPRPRTLKDNSTILFLDDGTVDMGSSFDLFDEASFTVTPLIDSTHQAMRLIFKQLMDEAGFTNYEKEWWHFTLRDEPFPNTLFDFDIE